YDPVYDDSGRMVKFVRGTLEIEAYMFPGCLEPFETSTRGFGGMVELPYHSAGEPGTGAVTALIVNGDDVTTDTTLNVIKARLSEPCQPLSFTDQGFGDVRLNFVSGSQPQGPQDVDNGPKPQKVQWQPLTNKSAKVNWVCEFAFSPCANPNTGELESQIAQ